MSSTGGRTSFTIGIWAAWQVLRLRRMGRLPTWPQNKDAASLGAQMTGLARIEIRPPVTRCESIIFFIVPGHPGAYYWRIVIRFGKLSSRIIIVLWCRCIREAIGSMES